MTIEFKALWEALAQYVENSEDVEGDDSTQDAKLAAARVMLEEMDMQFARLALGDAR